MGALGLARRKTLIIGAGGFARELLWLIEDCMAAGEVWEICGIVGDAQGFHTHAQHLLMRTDAEAIHQFSPEDTQFLIAIGNARVRSKIAQRYVEAGFSSAPPVIHPSVRRSQQVRIGAGTIICAGSTLTTDIEIGQHCVINLHCTVGHDAAIGDCSVLAPSVNISGNVRIGASVQIGTAAVVIPNVSIADHIQVGAGAVVTQSLAEIGTYVGVPAKKIVGRSET